MDRVALWNGLAAQFCVDGIRASTAAGSGHPTSSMSSAHLLAVLYADHLRFDVAEPRALANDRLVLSKGHASPLIFSVLKAIGAIDDAQLMSFRKMGSPIQGHPVPLPDMPYIDVATGSLGQGLPIGLGMALAMRLDGNPARVWVLMGDSEMAEGSVWEAMANASHHGVANLVGICDMNRLGQRGPTMLQWDGAAYVSRASAFGWNAIALYGQVEMNDIITQYTIITPEMLEGDVYILRYDEEGRRLYPVSRASVLAAQSPPPPVDPAVNAAQAPSPAVEGPPPPP